MPITPTPLDGTPSIVYQATTEKIPYGFDFSANCNTGESVANPTSTMVDLGTKQTVVLPDPPVIKTGSTTVISQELRGSSLVAGHNYRLIVSADIVGAVTGKTLAISTNVSCPY